MSTIIYMRPLSRLWGLACQARMSVALDGNNCCVASFFNLEAKLHHRPILSPFFPLPLIRPLTQTGVFRLLPLARRRRIASFSLKDLNRGQEVKSARGQRRPWIPHQGEEVHRH